MKYLFTLAAATLVATSASAADLVWPGMKHRPPGIQFWQNDHSDESVPTPNPPTSVPPTSIPVPPTGKPPKSKPPKGKPPKSKPPKAQPPRSRPPRSQPPKGKPKGKRKGED